MAKIEVNAKLSTSHLSNEQTMLLGMVDSCSPCLLSQETRGEGQLVFVAERIYGTQLWCLAPHIGMVVELEVKAICCDAKRVLHKMAAGMSHVSPWWLPAMPFGCQVSTGFPLNLQVICLADLKGQKPTG